MNLSVLYKLQEHECELKRVEKQMDELNNNEEAQKLKKEYQRLKSILDKDNELIKSNMLQQTAKLNEIKNLEKSMVQVQNGNAVDKLYDELNEKLNTAHSNINKLKDEGISIEKDVVSVKKKLNFIGKKYLQNKDNSKSQLEQLQLEAEKLTSAADALLPEVNQALLKVYKRVKVTFENPVATVDARLCGGCRMEIPALDYEAAKLGKEMVRCESCGRILFYQKPNVPVD